MRFHDEGVSERQRQRQDEEERESGRKMKSGGLLCYILAAEPWPAEGPSQGLDCLLVRTCIFSTSRQHSEASDKICSICHLFLCCTCLRFPLSFNILTILNLFFVSIKAALNKMASLLSYDCFFLFVFLMCVFAMWQRETKVLSTNHFPRKLVLSIFHQPGFFLTLCKKHCE